MKTSVEELPQNRVRLEVEVPEGDVKHALEHAASDLAGSVRIPGFRKGHVPMPVVVARIGREALWEEALRGHIDSWFWSAAESSGVKPVASPQIEPGDRPEDGGPFRFTATVDVMPKPALGDWTQLEVPAPEPEVPEEVVAAELDALRASVAELVPVTGRPVQIGDTVVLDLTGAETGTQRDYVADVGGGRLIEEIDQELVGMAARESKTVELLAPDGTRAFVEVTVKEIKERLLPELDDDLARAASEFNTLSELRSDIEQRLREAIAAELEGAFREDAVDALVAASDVAVPDALVDRRTAELWTAMTRSLERRGVTVDAYLTMTGQSQQQVIARLRDEADRAVKRELVLDALAEKLGVEVSDAEVETFVREQSDETEKVDETLKLMRERGVFEQLRTDLRLKRALDELVAAVKKIPVELAHAREKLWTPEKEKPSAGLKIWTPGSEEAQTR